VIKRHDPFDRYPLPWRALPELGRVFAANGALVCMCVAYDEQVGVRPEIESHAEAIAAAVNAGQAINIAGAFAEVQEKVTAWADEVFPGRRPEIAFMKLFEEVGEVVTDPYNRLEWADLIVLIVDLAAMYGIRDLGSAVLEKIKINRERQWARSKTGVMSHVE